VTLVTGARIWKLFSIVDEPIHIMKKVEKNGKESKEDEG